MKVRVAVKSGEEIPSLRKRAAASCSRRLSQAEADHG